MNRPIGKSKSRYGVTYYPMSELAIKAAPSDDGLGGSPFAFSLLAYRRSDANSSVTLPKSNSQDWLRVSFFALVRAKRNGHVRGAVGAALAKES